MSLRSRMVPPKWKRIRAELIDPSRLEGRDHGLIGQPQEADSFHAHDSLRFAERFLRLRIRDEVAQRDRIKGNPKEHRRGCLQEGSSCCAITLDIESRGHCPEMLQGDPGFVETLQRR